MVDTRQICRSALPCPCELTTLITRELKYKDRYSLTVVHTTPRYFFFCRLAHHHKISAVWGFARHTYDFMPMQCTIHGVATCHHFRFAKSSRSWDIIEKLTYIGTNMIWIRFPSLVGLRLRALGAQPPSEKVGLMCGWRFAFWIIYGP